MSRFTNLYSGGNKSGHGPQQARHTRASALFRGPGSPTGHAGSFFLCSGSTFFAAMCFIARSRGAEARITEQPSGLLTPENPPAVPIDVEQCYRSYAPMVLRRCEQLLNDRALAKDTMQDVFVKLCAKQIELEDRGLSSLLYRMATNLSLNQIRKRKTRSEDASSEVVYQIAIAQAEQSKRSEARNLLDRIFAKDNEEIGVTAVLHWVDGMTLKEVAQAQQLSVSGVRKRLAKIRANMRALGLDSSIVDSQGMKGISR